MDLQSDIAKYHDTVFGVAIGYVKNTHDAEDIVQNVFLKLRTKAPSLTTDEDKKSWLIRVAINESKNLLKSAWRRNTCEMDESLVARDNFAGHDLQLHDYLKRLKPKYRTVIFLYYYEGYSAKEVAGILRIPQATVLTQLKRAREQLKEMLENTEVCYE